MFRSCTDSAKTTQRVERFLSDAVRAYILVYGRLSTVHELYTSGFQARRCQEYGSQDPKAVTQ